jgi:RNA polymerase sigma-70 factor (ECF subfamily)
MRLETAARTEKVERPDISEARLTETQDHVLVEEALNGSSAAFGVLFERHQLRVLRVTWRVLRNQEDAEDAAQQAFEHAYVHLSGFHRQSRFSTWLTRIAINDALMVLRKRRLGHVSMEESKVEENEDMPVETHNAAVTPEQLCEARELREMLSSAIGELKPILGKVVQLRDLDELSARQTAKALELPIGTVKARTFRARRLLRRKLAKRLGLSRPKAVGSLFVESRNERRNRREVGMSRPNHRNLRSKQSNHRRKAQL